MYAGLFGYNKGVIKNLGIVDCDISANSDETARYLYAGICEQQEKYQEAIDEYYAYFNKQQPKVKSLRPWDRKR